MCVRRCGCVCSLQAPPPSDLDGCGLAQRWDSVQGVSKQTFGPVGPHTQDEWFWSSVKPQPGISDRVPCPNHEDHFKDIPGNVWKPQLVPHIDNIITIARYKKLKQRCHLSLRSNTFTQQQKWTKMYEEKSVNAVMAFCRNLDREKEKKISPIGDATTTPTLTTTMSAPKLATLIGNTVRRNRQKPTLGSVFTSDRRHPSWWQSASTSSGVWRLCF